MVGSGANVSVIRAKPGMVRIPDSSPIEPKRKMWIGLTTLSRVLPPFGSGLEPSGEFSENSGQGEIGICFNGESSEETPGRMLVFKVTGRAEVRQLAPGADCTPDPGNNDDDDDDDDD